MVTKPPISPDIFKEAQEELTKSEYAYIGDVQIKDYREFWSRKQKMLRTYHEASRSGRGVVQMYAEVMDELLEHLYDNARGGYLKKHGKEWPASMSLIALGGYGRGELSPHSDVDLLLLYSGKLDSEVLMPMLEVFNEEVIHALWDLKVSVKYAYRTIGHTITDAKRNFRIKNGQLDGRLVSGSREQFDLFHETYDIFFKNEPIEVFENQCLEDKEQRHRKYDYTVFLQEPDIRAGVGGIYDYQTILWLGRARLKASTIEAIEHKGGLSRSEVIQLEKAYDFLLRVRNELHFQNDGGNNLLNIEKQSQVAWGLGYRDENVFARVKTFMSEYYRHAQGVREISEHFEERLKQLGDRKEKQSWLRMILRRGFKKRQNQGLKKYINGFIIANNCLTYESQNIFVEDPIRLIRVFRHVQQYRVELSYEIKELIKKSLHLIDERVINNPSSNRCFASILQSVGEVYPILTLMHELGVLPFFLPEFNEITRLIQQERYHQYTVDIHTLNAIRVLDEIFRYKNSKEKQYYEALRNTTKPWLLYVLILLHDLGKAGGIANHAEIGARIAKPILSRLEIDPTQQEYILFVIKNDQQMTRFWERYDMDDPQVPAAFALFVGDPELLNYFYIQTYCDARATAPGLWNSHKEILHTKLFERTLKFLVKYKGYIEKRIENTREIYKESIYKNNPNITENEAYQQLKSYPDNYFILNSTNEFNLHIQLFEQASKHIEKSSCSGSLMPIIHWNYDIDQCLTVVTIVTWDRTGFFASLAGTLALSNFNILEAKAFSRSDQMCIIEFHIMESNDSNETNEYLKEKFYKNLRQILMNNVNLESLIAMHIKKHYKNNRLAQQRLKSIPRITSRINVNYERLEKETVIEIHCRDQIGLVYQFTKAITQHGFNIIFSRILTEYGEIVSKFHIYKNNIDEITTINDLIKLRESINLIIEMEK